MRKIILLSAAFITGMVFSNSYGDISPNPLNKAESITAKDKKTTDIVMKEEHVVLSLKKYLINMYRQKEKVRSLGFTGLYEYFPQNWYRLYVEADFILQNQGESTTLEVGFPMVHSDDYHNFDVTVDGKSVPTSVTEVIKVNAWRVWPMDFPKGATRRVIVTYQANPNAGRLLELLQTGYILTTGANWKGPIGKAVIELRLEEISKSQLTHWTPAENCQFKRVKTASKENPDNIKECDAIVWTFTDFEPTTDIHIEFCPTVAAAETAKKPIPEIIKLLGDSEADVREGACYTMGELKAKQAVPELIKLMSDSTFRVRVAAMYALSDLQAKEAIPQIIKLLSDADSQIRIMAVYAVSVFDAREAIPELIKLVSDSDNILRRETVELLVKLQAKEAAPALIKLLSDTVENWFALDALVALQAKEAIPEIIKMLSNSSNYVRRHAIIALKDLQAKEAIPDITKLLSDPDKEVGKAAEDALRKLKGE
jgi:HEAT repeat protein